MSSYNHNNKHNISKPISPPKPVSDAKQRRHTSDGSTMAHLGPDSEETAPRGGSSARDGYASDSSRYSRAKQPINEAITEALPSAPGGSTTATLSPEILAQITSHVIQQLRSGDLHVASEILPSQQKTQAQQPARTNLQSGNRVDPSSDLPSLNVPSLHRQTFDSEPLGARPDLTSDAQPSPRLSRVNARTPSPRKAGEEGSRLQHSPDKHSNTAAESDKDERGSKHKGPSTISNEADMTIVERVWGDLFTEHGETTVRLGQFLRGIALHLIADYEPKHSLVITPEKLQHYYEVTKVDNEIYPWRVVFDDRTSSISRMFREISAQHHLIQHPGQENERPDLPGLTPEGFATWVTLLIKAHPSLEFERLAKTAREMPISNPDDPKERFPKEISRRLFPEHSDAAIAAKLQKAISVHCNLPFNTRQDSTEETRSNSSTNLNNPKRNSISASDHGQPSTTSGLTGDSLSQPPGERPNKSISHTDSGVIIDDDTPAPFPIERKRKPYVAAPGGGKNHEDQTHHPTAEAAKPTLKESKAPPSLSSLHSRNDQSKSRATPISATSPKPSTPAPVDIPETRRHRGSTTHRDLPPAATARRVRSPSVGHSNGRTRRSESDYGYGSSYASGSSLDSGETARRYREYDSIREKHSTDHYDAARMAAVDSRERDSSRGHSRARGHSISTTPRASYLTEDDYHRMYGGHAAPLPPPPHSATTAPSRESHSIYVPSSTPLSAGYPPTAFRDSRSDASDLGVGSGRRAKDTDSFGDYSRSPLR